MFLRLQHLPAGGITQPAHARARSPGAGAAWCGGADVRLPRFPLSSPRCHGDEDDDAARGWPCQPFPKVWTNGLSISHVDDLTMDQPLREAQQKWSASTAQRCPIYRAGQLHNCIPIGWYAECSLPVLAFIRDNQLIKLASPYVRPGTVLISTLDR
ncbi:unnamed protein product [Schistocephalus solidus]|uniref:Uncharacterized protein n=1 Tax=Schistocephalus solidus TaxID=70667 RepID=A0A183TH45_SCHSO|nr:unnamed protein product [Schistocephalus solidus]